MRFDSADPVPLPRRGLLGAANFSPSENERQRRRSLAKVFVMAQPFAQPCGRGFIEAEPCLRALGGEIAASHKCIVITACVLTSSMAFIDGSALTVALPKLRAVFGADLAAVQWTLNGYVLALARDIFLSSSKNCRVISRDPDFDYHSAQE